MYKGVVPAGWSGYTYDVVPGTGTREGVFLGNSALPNNAWSLAMHEVTHAIDAVTGFTGRDGAFISLYQRYRARPHPSDPVGSYRMSNISEFFAVGIDDYFCGADTRDKLRSWYPDVHSYFTGSLVKSQSAWTK